MIINFAEALTTNQEVVKNRDSNNVFHISGDYNANFEMWFCDLIKSINPFASRMQLEFLASKGIPEFSRLYLDLFESSFVKLDAPCRH